MTVITARPTNDDTESSVTIKSPLDWWERSHSVMNCFTARAVKHCSAIHRSTQLPGVLSTKMLYCRVSNPKLKIVIET